MIYKHNGSIITDNTGQWLTHTDIPVDPYNPLGLPANTIRCKFSSGYTPTIGDSQTLVDSTNNVWDIYRESNYWTSAVFNGSTYLLEILGANTTNVTSMYRLFRNCTSLTTVYLFDTRKVTTMESMFQNCSSLIASPLFNTSNVTNMNQMFNSCTSLTAVPLLDTSKVTNMGYMFQNCTNVAGGAYALYQQASSQAIPPSTHNMTFTDCGKNTATGRSDLRKIPYAWGGTQT